MGIFNIPVEGTVEKVELRNWKFMGQLGAIRIGLPPEVTLIDVLGNDGKEYHGFLFGRQNIAEGSNIAVILGRPWKNRSVYKCGSESEVRLYDPGAVPIMGTLYMNIKDYKVS